MSRAKNYLSYPVRIYYIVLFDREKKEKKGIWVLQRGGVARTIN